MLMAVIEPQALVWLGYVVGLVTLVFMGLGPVKIGRFINMQDFLLIVATGVSGYVISIESRVMAPLCRPLRSADGHCRHASPDGGVWPSSFGERLTPSRLVLMG